MFFNCYSLIIPGHAIFFWVSCLRNKSLSYYLNDFVPRWVVTQNIFLLLSKGLWSRINSCYSILFSNLKQKRTTLLIVDLLAVTWVPCILRHIDITTYIETPDITMGIETPDISTYIETPHITMHIETLYNHKYWAPYTSSGKSWKTGKWNY